MEMVRSEFTKLYDKLPELPQIGLRDYAAKSWEILQEVTKTIYDGANYGFETVKSAMTTISAYDYKHIQFFYGSPAIQSSQSDAQAKSSQKQVFEAQIYHPPRNVEPSKGDFRISLVRNASLPPHSSSENKKGLELAKTDANPEVSRKRRRKVVKSTDPHKRSVEDDFNDICMKPLKDQGIIFLNAYWEEFGDQAEFIFEVAYEMMKMADMHVQGISLVHKYVEGCKLNEMGSLYFYEKLCKFVLHDPAGAKWRNDPKYRKSLPTMMTSIERSRSLRKIDINYDNHLSFIEYLLDQYCDTESPEDFIARSRPFKAVENTPEIKDAENHLANLITSYDKQIHHLEQKIQEARDAKSKTKVLVAEQELTHFLKSPHGSTLRVALIKAEAAVRLAKRKMYGLDQILGGKRYLLVPYGTMYWQSKQLSKEKIRHGPSSATRV